MYKQFTGVIFALVTISFGISNLNPIVIVPGAALNRMEYRLKNEENSAYKPIWFEINAVSKNKSIYVKDMQIKYDHLTDEYSSADHIDIRPQNYGGIEGITIIDPEYPQTERFRPTIEHLESIGYQAGKNLFGGPYDFRLAGPTNLKKFGVFVDLQKLIEKAYEMNNNKKVFIIGHSFGCTLANNFLSTFVSTSWKQKYIEAYLSISGPYGGAVECFASVAAYRQWIVPGITLKESYDGLKYMAPNYWMLPNKFGFDEDNDIIAEIPSINISLTIKNMTWVFESTGRQKQLKASNNVKDIRNQIQAPGVKSYIFMCTGVNTIVKMLYNYNFSQSQLNESKETQVSNQEESQQDYWWKHEGVEIYGDGDNSVSVKSLRVPHLWKEMQKEPVIFKEYSGNGVDHSGILRDKKFLNDLSEILVGNKTDEGKEL